MSRYRFHGLTLEVDPAELEVRARLPRLWADLSWRRLSDDGQRASSHRFALHLHDEPRPLRAGVHQVFSTESFSGFSAGEDDFYVTDSQSLLHLRTDSLEADAWLAPSFFDKPLTLQYTFWSFAIAKLMRSIGLFALHAAGLVRPTNEDGVLIIGRSSSGKTTLTLDAIRHGWRYVSDDAVLLDRAAGGAGRRCAWPWRRGYIDSDASARHDGFSFGASTGITRAAVVAGSSAPNVRHGELTGASLACCCSPPSSTTSAACCVRSARRPPSLLSLMRAATSCGIAARCHSI